MSQFFAAAINLSLRPGLILRALVLVASLLVTTAQGEAKAPAEKLLPVDEAAKDASFKAFRDKLLDAIDRRDRAFILSIVAADFVSCEGCEGGNDFQEVWQLDDPTSELWDTLGTLLRLGGTFEKDGSFTAPYVFSRFPQGLDDNFDYVVAVREAVELREAPQPDAAVLERLSYNILRVDDPSLFEDKLQHQAADSDWMHVQSLAGRHGYVKARDVRSPADFHASFVKRQGRWVLKALYETLVEGD